MFFEGPILGSFLRPPVSVTGTLSKRSPRCHSPPRALPGRPLGASGLLFHVFLVHLRTHCSSLSRPIPRHVDFTEFAPCLRNKHGFEGPSPQNFSLWASLFGFRLHKKVIFSLCVAFGQKCPSATFGYPLLCLFWPNPAPPSTFLRKGGFLGGPPNSTFRHRVNISEC